MKRYFLYLLTAILGMLNIQPASAQQTQDALYIFRNDGAVMMAPSTVFSTMISTTSATAR